MVLNGHGNERIIGGHDDEPLLKMGENEGITEDMVMYVRTCKSGKQIGKKCVDEGADVFIGYEG
ncbi:MAG: hypothetical protein ABEI86_12120, partial [Halobacteriaceae archaeon]